MFAPRLIVLQPTPYCSINCSYCYLGQRNERTVMPMRVVQAVAANILSQIARHEDPTIVWHGGEPTTVPISWYREAYGLLEKSAPPRTSFAFQSNGISIDEKWVAFFKETRTQVSLSIDGPQAFHDERRRTRNGGPTWHLAMRGLKSLQQAGLEPGVITVLSRGALGRADEFYAFYRDNGITRLSFSIDEKEAANANSSFKAEDSARPMAAFLTRLLELSYRDGFPLHLREVERIAAIASGHGQCANEQVEAWKTLTVTADGSISTFSPEFVELHSPAHFDHRWNNVFDFSVEAPVAAARRTAFADLARDIAKGVDACRATCRYFNVCGGGAPVNKQCELGSVAGTETVYCRQSTQAAADALFSFFDAFRQRHAAVQSAQVMGVAR